MSTPQQERKRIGLVIGIEYWLYANHNIADSLPGCHRDAKHMYNLLKKYKYDKIVLMIDDDATPPELQPTRKNILQMIATLAREAENADLFISNASHGSQLSDFSKTDGTNFEVGDEPDNLDETLVPLDYLGSVDAKGKLIPSENQIRDDELKRVLADNLHPTSRLVFFSDSCHSSSILDLPYVYNLVDTPKEKDSVILKESSESNSVLQYPCPVMCLSGCKDNQTSLSVVNETTKGLKGLANTNEKVKIVTRDGKPEKRNLQQQTVIVKNGQNIANKKVPARAVGAFRDERDSVTWEGAATFSLLTALEFLQYRGSWPTVFKNVRKVLQDKGYEQKPMLSSSMHLGQMSERQLQDLYFATWEVDESVSRDPMPRYTTNSQKSTTL